MFTIVCMIAAGSVFTGPLLAQKLAPGEAAQPSKGSDMVTLPTSWKVITDSADTSNPIAPAGPNLAADPQSSSVVLAAASPDPKRNITLSLYVYRFREWGPSIMAGDMGAEMEASKLMQAVLMQGYTPSAKQITTTATAGNRPIVTIEVTAKNGAGEERIFTDTAVIGSASYRLYTARPSADPEATEEITAIIKSLNVPLTQPGVAVNRVPGAGGAAPSVPFGVPQPGTPGAGTRPGVPQPPGAQLGGANPAVVNNSVSTLAATGPASPEAAQIVQDYHGALVMVEGNKGVGSGFLCKLDGRTYVITNAHVLADNNGVKFTSLDGTSFTTGSSAVAVDHDIVRLEVAAGAPKSFEVMAPLDSTAKIGDAVMIPGNAEGAQVVHPVEGKIVGIGPNLVEVDAAFVKGNSGSPIVHVATGKVLGVATYVMQKRVNKDVATGQVVIETRRFGYRIDSVKQWQQIDWRIFFQESQQVAAIEDLSDDFITMFNDMQHGELSAEHYKSPTMSRAVRSFTQAKNNLSMTASMKDREDTVRGFLSDLRAATKGDITVFTSKPAYDYFRRDVDDQARFRDELYDIFTRAIQNADALGDQPQRRPVPRYYQGQ